MRNWVVIWCSGMQSITIVLLSVQKCHLHDIAFLLLKSNFSRSAWICTTAWLPVACCLFSRATAYYLSALSLTFQHAPLIGLWSTCSSLVSSTFVTSSGYVSCYSLFLRQLVSKAHERWQPAWWKKFSLLDSVLKQCLTSPPIWL